MPPVAHYTCPVCGWDQLAENPRCPTYEICPCCGTEFGYDDYARSPLLLRAQWVARGMRWWSRHRAAPEGWNAWAQLRRAFAPCP